MNLLMMIILAVSAPTTPGTAAVVGLWESKEISQGGIGHAYEFRPDGTYVESSVVMVPFLYRMEKDRLTVEFQGSEPVLVATIRFEGNSVVLTSPDGTTRRERMRPQAGGSSIVGDWRYCHPLGVTAYDRFTDDGKLLLRLPMGSSTGRYSLESGVLTLSKAESRGVARAPLEPGAGPIKAEVRGDDLVIKHSAGKTSEYRREPTGAWYDLTRSEQCTPGVAVPSPSATPPPAGSPSSVLPHVRSHPPIERFVGVWRNVDPAAEVTGPWPKIEISATKDTLSIRILGVPGVSTAQYKGAPIILSMETQRTKIRFVLSLENDILRMATEEVFKDASGHNRFYDTRFRKATK